MLAAQHLLPNRQRSPHQVGGLLKIAFVLMQHREIVEALGGEGMGRAERGFADGEGAFVQRTGGSVVAFVVMQQREIVEAGGGEGMGRVEGGFVDGEGAFVQRTGGSVVAD